MRLSVNSWQLFIEGKGKFSLNCRSGGFEQNDKRTKKCSTIQVRLASNLVLRHCKCFQPFAKPKLTQVILPEAKDMPHHMR